MPSGTTSTIWPSSSRCSLRTDLSTPLRVEDDPDPAAIAVLDDNLAGFLVAMAGGTEARPLAVLVREGEQVVAGIHGWTWSGCCELLSLWVEPSRRRSGLGHALLDAAEGEARRRDCTQVVLFTHAAVPPSFYLRAGYGVLATVDGYPAGSAAHWLHKALDPGPA